MAEKKAPTVRDPESLYERENTQILERLGRNPLLAGRLLERVALSTSPTRITHGLAQPYRGYIVVKASNDVNVWVDSASDTSPSRFISLVASDTATVSLWVF